MKKIRLLVLLSALALVLVACGSEDATDGTSGTDDGSNEDVAAISVEAFDFGFEPNSISLDAGEEVELTFTNTGGAPHTFTSEELDVDIRTSAGGDGTATFTAPEDGTYAFGCSIHPTRMQGEIIVGTGGAGAGDDGTTEGESENDDGTTEGGAENDDGFDY